jgi:HAD superfamily hydrolase (TIGR01509 family)
VEEPRAILFDLDGVLVESREAWFRVVQAAARHFRTADVDRARFDAGWGQGVDADVRDFFPGCSQADVERFYEDRLLDYGDFIEPDPEARATLARLRDLQVPRGVVTNTPTFLARDILAFVALVGLVDVTVGAGGAVRPKPEADSVRAACEALEVLPQHTLLVGDSLFDEKAARAAGARFLGLRMANGGSAQSLSEVLRFFERARA